MPLLALAAWAGGLAAWHLPAAVAAAVGLTTVVATALAAVATRRGVRRVGASAVGAGLVLSAVLCAGLVRGEQVQHNPVAELAAERAVVSATGVVVSDPRPVAGRHDDLVVLRMEVRDVLGRGVVHRLAAPVLVLGDDRWRHVPLGTTVQVRGRLAPAHDADLAALLEVHDLDVRAPPDVWWRGAGAVRSSLRESVAHRPDDQRVLVPALVVGDDAALDPALAEDFRTTGLTHLLAVSGTNLTLMVGALLVAARWCGVRGRWLHLVAGAGIAGFVLLARTEPSVLRAAAMGTVALVGMGRRGRDRGTRALGVAVVVLLLVDPSLAAAPGFALSVLATAGILLLGPPWRDALARWLPRWLAEAVAVPTAAQLACTPVVAALSGEVSLAAVIANLLVAWAVGPATVLGLAAGLTGLATQTVGDALGTAAAWCVSWIVLVARHGADLPTAAIPWGTGAVPLTLLALLTVAIAWGGPRVVARPVLGGTVTTLSVLVVVLPRPTPGWPPADWLMAMCDVGQGDALVLNAGPAGGVVVDAGPDPVAVDRCLDRLDVERVPLLVLTHFHADHVDGLEGVLGDRVVGGLETTPHLDPDGGVRDVVAAGLAAGVPATVAPWPSTRTVGEATLQVLWPTSGAPVEGPGDGSAANDASVVLLAEVRGVRLLLSGDVEPRAQAALADAYPGLSVDVLKVPHHGSRHQDLDFLRSLGASVALVSVGEDNDYGHPSATVLDALAATGAEVRRTDRDGDVVVAGGAGGLRVVRLP